MATHIILLIAIMLASFSILAEASTLTDSPSYEPSVEPSYEPSVEPSYLPSTDPSDSPTIAPSASPSFVPTFVPTFVPSPIPTAQPTFLPSSQPSRQPSSQPSQNPTSQPTSTPTNLIHNTNSALVQQSVKDVNSAVFSGSVSAVVAALKTYDAQGDQKNVKFTAITSAIFANEPTMVDVIIDTLKMNVNTQGAGSGNSFLMWACHWGNQLIAESLLKQGADLTLKNKDGDTALSLAAKGGHRNIVALLRAGGATV